MNKWIMNAARLLLLSLMVQLLEACSSTPHVSSPPNVAAPTIPALSPELKREPLPTGSYWAGVMQWRKTWDETLKTLQLKSEASSGSTPPR